jgi:hypothetical protein
MLLSIVPTLTVVRPEFEVFLNAGRVAHIGDIVCRQVVGGLFEHTQT